MHEARTRTTAMLASLGECTESARSAEEFLPLVYAELRRLAQRYLASERPGHTLQATALVHEAYTRLVDPEKVDWQGRTHFFAVSARAMRRVLVDHARRRGSRKRGGDWQQVTLGQAAGKTALGHEELLGLDAALGRLAELDAQQAQLVELRFFAGMPMAEIAAVLGVSKRTAEAHWTHARAWLNRELAPGTHGAR